MSSSQLIVRIFYLQALKALELQEFQNCKEMMEIGLSLCRKNRSLYLLKDFLYLKGMLLEEINRLDEAVQIVEIAEKIHAFEVDGAVK